MKQFVLLFMCCSTFISFAQGDIYLSLPSDGELIKDKTLNFAWQSSSIANQDDPRLSQDLVVSEMDEEQSPFEALEVNSPVLNRSKIIGNNYYVSNSDFPFKEGKKYAWQIRYYMSGVLISRSEAWWFELALPEPKFLSFFPLRSKFDGQVLTIFNPQLNVSVLTKGDLNLKVSIVSEKGDVYETEIVEYQGKESSNGEKSEGTNNSRNFIVNLKNLKLKNGLYSLKWTPAQNETYTLMFELKK